MLCSPWSNGESPVICGDCRHSVPLYTLPYILGETEYNSALGWKQKREDITDLYVLGLSDRFTSRQMSNPDSQLSQEGRHICTEYEKVVRVPFYYYLVSRSASCPVCGGKWKSVDVYGMCDECRLIVPLDPQEW
jgi:predicted  nucleic acid-binding Zn ribbon protein